MGNFWKLAGDDPVGFDYAAGDGTATWHLYHKQLESMSTPFDAEGRSLDAIRRLESGVTRTVYRMTRRGVRIDEGRLAWVIDELGQRLAQASKALPDNFNVRSSSQIRGLMERAGHTDWPLTDPTPRFPNGNPSFTEKWLKSTPLGRDILAIRKYGNLLNSFAIPTRDRHIHNGRVHATFTQMANDEFGTITGRFSSSEPNLQHVPKRTKETAELIRSYSVPDEGLDWWDADLSQCEPRLLAHYGNVKVLVDGYLSTPPVDAHQAVATAAGIDREDGKRLNQTIITGGGRNKIISMLGPNGASIYDRYFEAMPEVKSLQKIAARRMEQRGYVISLKGRLARLESSSKSYLAINRLLQCGNADIMKEAMVRIDSHFEAEGDEVAILNTVHDALGFQADANNKQHRKIMEHALRLFTDYGPDDKYGTYLRVPMAAEYGIGKNWAEATYPKTKLTYGG
jgi:DNA polymerase-1